MKERYIDLAPGVYPHLACAACATIFDSGCGAVMPARQHVFLCEACAGPGGTTLSAGAIAFLAAAGRLSPGSIDRMPLAGRAARELETAHRRLMNHHLEKELKSSRVLRELRQAR